LSLSHNGHNRVACVAQQLFDFGVIDRLALFCLNRDQLLFQIELTAFTSGWALKVFSMPVAQKPQTMPLTVALIVSPETAAVTPKMTMIVSRTSDALFDDDWKLPAELYRQKKAQKRLTRATMLKRKRRKGHRNFVAFAARYSRIRE